MINIEDLIIYLIAKYEITTQYKSTASFAIAEAREGMRAYLEDRITFSALTAYLIAGKAFANLYGKPPSDAEQMRLNLDEMNLKDRLFVLCISRLSAWLRDNSAEARLLKAVEEQKKGLRCKMKRQ